MLTLIYIGDHFYEESGTAMSSVYSDVGERFDWGKIKNVLRTGTPVTIRPATVSERARYAAQLVALLQERQ
jgi:hypothetical protein